VFVLGPVLTNHNNVCSKYDQRCRHRPRSLGAPPPLPLYTPPLHQLRACRVNQEWRGGRRGGTPIFKQRLADLYRGLCFSFSLSLFLSFSLLTYPTCYTPTQTPTRACCFFVRAFFTGLTPSAPPERNRVHSCSSPGTRIAIMGRLFADACPAAVSTAILGICVPRPVMLLNQAMIDLR
jgi:hypothetical protein